MSSTTHINIGLCGIGLEAYWDQFAGLKQRLEANIQTVAKRLAQHDVHITNLGMIDSTGRAREAGHAFRRAEIEVLFLYTTTYALSSTVLPLVKRIGVPVIVLNLQPGPAIHYATFNKLNDRTAMTGEWLAWCSACPVPEIANVFARAGIQFHEAIGVLGDEQTWSEIEDWLAAAKVKSQLENNRLGLLGHYYSGMLDIMTDVTQICITFGGDVEVLEVDELSALREQVPDAEITRRISEFQQHFDIQPDCSDEELRRAARTSVALDTFVAKHRLTSLACYYKGTGVPANEDTMSSIILGTSLLTSRHIPVAGEYEVKNAIAMKIMDALNVGGSFTEYYALDYAADVVLMGHDGPGHIAIAEGKTKVKPLQVYHGKVGRGLSVEMSVKHGPVTLLSIVEDPGHSFKLIAAEGESVSGSILEIGNTNSRYRFPVGAKQFTAKWNAQGPAHHCAVGVGHIAHTLEKLARLLGIPFHQIC
ncbi:MAG TPA: arabinose isomerase [Pseudacidobacterium sp.]|nr:arabinose isomerase [Pseudacidobacterium sp.]